MGLPRLAVCLFQSTPPRGGRPDTEARRCDNACFNPRPRAGGDAKAAFRSLITGVFQSTPPRGGRLVSAVSL